MARAGTFGGSLNPFGTGSLGSFAQYDIAADLADLEVYQVEVRWGNGLAADDEYLAALTRARDATDPSTRRRETAQNKLDDAVYRVGRSRAEEQGLDELIAFDQAELAKMNPDNVRYRNVKDSLDSELARRRSRDYGEIVDDYNAGNVSTETLKAWVDRTLGALTEDDPDFDNWSGVQADLTDRIQNERDSGVYQDYQHDRITGQAFVAYVRERRDTYAPESPQYDEWTRKLEDAEENVKDKAQSAKDSAFFNRYEQGKVSDKTYLKYLATRIDGMDKSDSQLGEWKHRLHQATFSLAEDKLRFDVERGKQPVSKLLTFYRTYRTTLNPGSAEWRTITRRIDNLKGYSGGGGGGGGGGRGAGGGGGGGGATLPASTGVDANLPLAVPSPNDASAARGGGKQLAPGKVISPRFTLETVLGKFAIDPTARKSDIAATKKAYDLNLQSLADAVREGDEVWLYHDPAKPGQTVAGRYPDGSPKLDANGKQVMVRGSGYLPSSNEALANLKMVEASNWSSAAEYALANGKSGDYWYAIKRAAKSMDQARAVDSQYREQSWEGWYKQASIAVDHLTRQNDYAGAAQMAFDLAIRLKLETKNPYLDDTRRNRLEEMGEKLAANPLFPTVDPATGAVLEGALNMNELARGKVTLNPGWNHVLKNDSAGRPDYGPVWSDDPEFEAKHATVHTTYGGKVVTGSVPIQTSAPVNPKVRVRTANGWFDADIGAAAMYLSFQTERGTTKAFSVDGGRTWISPGATQPLPTLEINADLVESKEPGGSGRTVYKDRATGEAVFIKHADGSWEPNEEYILANDLLDWYGAADWKASKAATKSLRRDEMRSEFLLDQVDGMELGGDGQRMTLAYMSPSGSLNLSGASLSDGVSTPAGRANAERTRLTKDTSADRDLIRFMADATKDDRYLSASALPSDTPDRYDGLSIRVMAKIVAPTVIPKIAKVAPGLTPLGRGGAPYGSPPALRPSAATFMASATKDDAFVPPKLKASAKPALKAAKKKPPPAPRKPAAKSSSSRTKDDLYVKPKTTTKTPPKIVQTVARKIL